MAATDRIVGESLVDYSARLARLHQERYCHESRSAIGQYFTTASIARFMAEMLSPMKDRMSILDPGAGTGVLSAAICEEILKSVNHVAVELDAYETDPNVLPFLEKTLHECKVELDSAGHKLITNILTEDFIQANREHFRESSICLPDRPVRLYDFAISNPPYYKIAKDSLQAKAMPELVAGQPNIYPFFMALTSRMLKPGGEMAFITPRSFCSGLYYKSFRRWMLDRNKIAHIHIFESRSDIFDGEEVLQENIITRVQRCKPEDVWDISLSVSEGKDITNPTRMVASSKDIIYRHNGDIFIRIPTTAYELEVIHVVDKWPYTLRQLGYEISTGPVIDFRTDRLIETFECRPGQVPLLWAHNLRNGGVKWPNGKKKEQAIEDVEETRSILLPVQNYVLLKRFSTKEQKRRIEAAVMNKKNFGFERIGLENHLNYIHKPGGELSAEEANGLAGFLNTTLIDNFFRSLSGHTQVNATEIRCLPFPSAESIVELGRRLMIAKGEGSSLSVDDISSDVLGVDKDLILRIGRRANGENSGGSIHTGGPGITQSTDKRKERLDAPCSS